MIEGALRGVDICDEGRSQGRDVNNAGLQGAWREMDRARGRDTKNGGTEGCGVVNLQREQRGIARSVT